MSNHPITQNFPCQNWSKWKDGIDIKDGFGTPLLKKYQKGKKKLTHEKWKKGQKPNLWSLVEIGMIGDSTDARQKAFWFAGIQLHFESNVSGIFYDIPQDQRTAGEIIEQVKEYDLSWHVEELNEESEEMYPAWCTVCWNKIHG